MAGIITAILVLSIVWGGFLLLLFKAVKSERAKGE